MQGNVVSLRETTVWKELSETIGYRVAGTIKAFSPKAILFQCQERFVSVIVGVFSTLFNDHKSDSK